MATYDYMTSLKNSGRKVQVESAKRDGDGKNIANNYAKQVGYYEGMGAGTADNLTPYSDNSGIAHHKSFVFQSTASGSDVFALCQLKSLRGQSYVLNQLMRVSSSHEAYNVTTTFDSATGIFTSVGMSTATSVEVSLGRCFANKVGHKILLKLQIISNPDNASVKLRAFNDNNGNAGTFITSGSTGFIFVASQEQGSYIGFVEENAVELTALQYRLQCFDLTQMFGAGKEPTTVEEFNRLFPLPYYEYNTGELVSSQASKLITVGYNQFDELDTFIKVVAGQTYTIEGITNGSVVEYDGNQNQIGIHSITETTNITLTNNTQYVKVLGTGSNICFHLTWDGSKTGYEAYSKHEYVLPNEVLRSAGSAYDEIKSNGTKITRIGVVDLGNLTIEQYGSKEHTFWVGNASQFNNNLKLNPYGQIPNLLIADYTPRTLANTVSNDVDLSITVHDTQQRLVICDKRYDATTEAGILAFKSSLSGKYLFYELATPVESDSIAFQENIAIDDWGTMEFNSTYPQGNEFFYYVDYKAFIDSLGNRGDIGFDASKIVSQEELAEALADIDLSDYVTKLLSIESQRHLTSGEAKQCVGGVQVVSDYYLNLGGGTLLKNPYITGIQTSTTKIQIFASGLNTSNQMVFHKAELTINASDDTVAVTEGSITTVNGTDMANLITYAKGQGWIQ